MKSKLIFEDFVLTPADTIGGVTYRQNINSGTDLQYGCASMCDVSFAIRAENTLKSQLQVDKKFELQISQEETGENYKSFGFFYIDTINTRDGKTSVTAYDAMSRFDVSAKKFLNKTVYPITLYTLLENLCDSVNVPLANSSITNGDIRITQEISLSDGTLRNLLSYIAEIAAGYAYIDKNGALEIAKYTDATVTLDKTKYVSCWVAEYETNVITEVILSSSTGDVTSESDDSAGEQNQYVISNNPILNAATGWQNVADTIYDDLKDVAYTPVEIDLLSDHDINVGDVINVNGVKTVVMSKTMKPSGVTLSSSGNQNRDQYVSNEKQQAAQSQYVAETAKEELQEVKDELQEYVRTENLSASIDTYINSDAGTASIVGAVSGTFVTEDELGNFVKRTDLNTSIGQYIDSSSGTAKIISVASGTYQTKADMDNYATTTSVAKISQSISEIESDITLSSSYSNNTIGTNVYALLQLVSNANSSSIKIKADKINFDGFTTFVRASDLGASGSTSIDGGRILTGTISADRIDTTDLYLSQLRTKNGKYIIDYADNVLGVGGGTTNDGTSFAQFYYIDLMVEKGVRFGYGSYDAIMAREGTGFVLRPYSSPVDFSIGTSLYPIGYLYCKYSMYVDGKKVLTEDNVSSYIPDSLSTTDVKAIYASGSTSYKIELNSSKAFVPSVAGFSIGSSSYPFQELYIGYGSHYWKITNSAILPNTSSSSYYNIGSSSYPVQTIYAKSLVLDGTTLSPGSYAGTTVTMGGSSSYYIVCNTNRQLRPNTSSTSYPFYLGTSGYYWHYAYIGSDSASIGSTTSSKIGFFGKTPVTKTALSTSSTLAQLLTALISYGLV